jgi:hypothetical protein
VVTLPLLVPGFVLVYDMVFVPHPHLSRELLGISRTLPRSVPVEWLLALLSRAVTAMVVQKLVLIGIVGGAMYGAARLCPSDRPAARIGAGLLYAWNPFVYERLLLGQWVLLLGYAVLPWTAIAAIRVRRGERGAGWVLILAMALSSAAGSYAGVFAVALAVSMLAFPPWREGKRLALRRTMGALAGGIAVNLPWLVPAVLHPAVPGNAALATSLFRARADSPLGLVGSLASLGGLWRTDLAPPGRTGYAWIPAFLLVAGLAVVGWRSLTRRWPPGSLGGLLALAIGGVVLAAAPAIPGARTLTVWAVAHAPGGGFLRDSQKFVIPLALALSAGFGAGVEAALRKVEPGRDGPDAHRIRPVMARALPTIVLALLPAALSPTLAWAAQGKLSTATYPDSWARAQSIMARDPAPGAVLVLPWHAYLAFRWNDRHTVHQPATRYFSRSVVADGALEVGPFRLPPEDPWSRLADPLVRGPGPLEPALPGLGVRYVVLFKEADWRRALPKVAGLTLVQDEGDLMLLRSTGSARQPAFEAPPVAAVAAGDGLALLVVAMAATAIVRRRLGAAGVPPKRLAILRSQEQPAEGAE